MNFGQALEALKAGKKVKLPSWGGYWQWEDGSIKMHCKDGRTIDIRDMENVEYTMSNIASEEWLIADEENCPVLGGQNTFSFGEALKQLKKGLKVARQGWNGKGMWIVLMSALKLPPHSCQEPGAKVNDRTAKYIGEDMPLDSQPYIAMWTAQQKWQPGWLASQPDMLAEDWVIVE